MKDTLKKRVSGAIKNKIEDKVAEKMIEKGKALGGNIKSGVTGGEQKKEENVDNSRGMAEKEGGITGGIAQKGGGILDKKVEDAGIGGDAGKPPMGSGLAKEENPGGIGGVSKEGGKTIEGIAPEGPSKPILSKADYERKQAADLRFAKNPESIGAIKEKVGERAQNRKQFSQPKGAQRMGSIPDDPEAKAQKRAEIMAEVHNRTASKASSRLSGVGSGAHKSIKGEVNDKAKKEIEERMGEDLNWKQRFALRIASDIAGRRAVNILYAVAQKMEEQTEKGGGMAIVMIGITYLMAGIKDILDTVTFPIPGFGLALGIIFGTIISIFWLMICGSSHGPIARWFVKKALIRILAFSFLDGLYLFGALPLSLVMNAWTHWDYNKEIKKAERSLAEVNEKIVRVQRQVRANANSM